MRVLATCIQSIPDRVRPRAEQVLRRKGYWEQMTLEEREGFLSYGLIYDTEIGHKILSELRADIQANPAN